MIRNGRVRRVAGDHLLVQFDHLCYIIFIVGHLKVPPEDGSR
jgi:hypothetical protein